MESAPERNEPQTDLSRNNWTRNYKIILQEWMKADIHIHIKNPALSRVKITGCRKCFVR